MKSTSIRIHGGAFVSPRTVMVVVIYRDVAKDLLGKYISPDRIVDICEHYGQVVARIAYMPGKVIANHKVLPRWTRLGFKPIGDSLDDKDIAPIIQNEVQLHQPDVVVFVGSESIPDSLIGNLMTSGIYVALFSTKQHAPSRKDLDETLMLSDYVEGKPLPPRTALAQEHETRLVQVLFKGEGTSQSYSEQLEAQDPETHHLLMEVLTADKSSVKDVLQMLLWHEQKGALPKLVRTALIALSFAQFDHCETRLVPKDRLYWQLLRCGISVDTIGRLTLNLLAELGTLAIRHTGNNHDMDYAYALRHKDPTHDLARQFCKGFLSAERQLPDFSKLSYADKIMAALEILFSNPADMTGDPQIYLKDWLRRLLSQTSNQNMRRVMYNLGNSSPQEIKAFMVALEDLLLVPVQEPDSEPELLDHTLDPDEITIPVDSGTRPIKAVRDERNDDKVEACSA